MNDSATDITDVVSEMSATLKAAALPDYREFYAALAKAQGAFSAPKRTKTVTVRLSTGGSYTFSYAPLEEIIDAIRAGLAANGLSVGQRVVRVDGNLVLRTILRHESGVTEESDYPVFGARDTGQAAQGFASGVTYARRYGLSLALGLAPEDDDDANLAEGNTIEQQQRGAGSGKAQSQVKPQVNPLPKAPPQQQPPMDPETGEVGPHLIPVSLNARGESDWWEWGRKISAVLDDTKNRRDGERWVEIHKAPLGNCERDAPKVWVRVKPHIDNMRKRHPDIEYDARLEAEPDFLSAS